MSTPPRVILVVDDDSAVRRFIEAALESEGYAVVTAENGRQALQMLGVHAVDMVVTDLMMTGMDGAELARLLRHDTRLPVLMVSGNRDLVTPAVLADVDAFLPKPLALRDLLETVDRLLGARLV